MRVVLTEGAGAALSLPQAASKGQQQSLHRRVPGSLASVPRTWSFSCCLRATITCAADEPGVRLRALHGRGQRTLHVRVRPAGHPASIRGQHDHEESAATHRQCCVKVSPRTCISDGAQERVRIRSRAHVKGSCTASDKCDTGSQGCGAFLPEQACVSWAVCPGNPPCPGLAAHAKSVLLKAAAS